MTPLAKKIICGKATEYPNTGIYNTAVKQGTYLCRRCGFALFRGVNQFISGFGWPSFDEEIQDAVNEVPDTDGLRTEIVCSRCQGHLGHVFNGEYFTPKNQRYCVNSASIDFVPNDTVTDTEEAIVAGGCFWGVEYYLKDVPGVLKTEVGYTGGHTLNPSYEQVCAQSTGHFEAVRILFDRSQTDYCVVLKRFFEIHDPTQPLGQGPDLGYQYQSAVFYYNQGQLQAAQRLINILKNKGYDVVTRLLSVQTFWPAEQSHQNYYFKHQDMPYCHYPVNRFDT